ncbi:hypothetical protein [Actinocorallia lasiicapitis]
METENTEQTEQRARALSALGEALDSEGFTTRVVRAAGAAPFLRVTSGHAETLSENVTCTCDAAGPMMYAYSWGDVIGPVSEIPAAVARLAHVLAPLDAPEAAEVRVAPVEVIDVSDPAQARRAALEALAALLAEQQYVVRVGEFHLVAADRVGEGARLVEVWCQARPDRGSRLCFTWAGGALVCAADRPTDALVAVKTALLPRPR